MACGTKIGSLCFNKTYSSCVMYEGILPEDSPLFLQDCVTAEEVIEELIGRIKDLKEELENKPTFTPQEDEGGTGSTGGTTGGGTTGGPTFQQTIEKEVGFALNKLFAEKESEFQQKVFKRMNNDMELMRGEMQRDAQASREILQQDAQVIREVLQKDAKTIQTDIKTEATSAKTGIISLQQTVENSIETKKDEATHEITTVKNSAVSFVQAEADDIKHQITGLNPLNNPANNP